MFEQLEKNEKRYREIEEKLALPGGATNMSQLQELARERAAIEPVVKKYREYKSVQKSLEDTRAMLGEGLERELADLARQEIGAREARSGALAEELRLALIPKDPND